MAWLVRGREASRDGMSGLDRLAFGAYVLGGAGFTVMFLISGAMSIPRRWAVHLPEWMLQDQIATAFGALVVLSVVVLVVKYIGGLRS